MDTTNDTNSSNTNTDNSAEPPNVVNNSDDRQSFSSSTNDSNPNLNTQANSSTPTGQPQNQAPQPPPPQQTIVHVRDRLFHALFYRIAIIYARKFPKTLRRLSEFFALILALGSFALLSYLHIVFNRNPINCLEKIQEKWPRDGVLRVEIVHNASSLYIMSNETSSKHDLFSYSLEQSYEKEYPSSVLEFIANYIKNDEDIGSNSHLDESGDSESFTYVKDSHAQDDEQNNTSWFFNPLSYFKIKNHPSYSKSSSHSKSNSKKKHDEKQESADSETIAKSQSQTEELAKADDVTLSNEKTASTESSKNESDILPPPPTVQIEMTKKEIPTSTVETMSPAYKLIKEAFSELQLFTKVCKLTDAFVFFYK
jgi:hypothetical protein